MGLPPTAGVYHVSGETPSGHFDGGDGAGGTVDAHQHLHIYLKLLPISKWNSLLTVEHQCDWHGRKTCPSRGTSESQVISWWSGCFAISALTALYWEVTSRWGNEDVCVW